jgi:hypothetical protein
MAYCPKCGNKIEEDMSFCPKCGTSLKAAQPAAAPAPMYRRGEKEEKHEKQEKGEKGEKHEKRGSPFLGLLIGGAVLVFLGLLSYLRIRGYFAGEEMGAYFLIILGFLVVIGGLYAAIMASRRHPRA